MSDPNNNETTNLNNDTTYTNIDGLGLPRDSTIRNPLAQEISTEPETATERAAEPQQSILSEEKSAGGKKNKKTKKTNKKSKGGKQRKTNKKSNKTNKGGKQRKTNKK